ncbi:Aromatic amino acid transport protein AroP [compost metagenome]
MSLVVAALVINWAMISLAHLKFRASKERAGVQLEFKAFWYPFGNYLCLAFLLLILGVMWQIEGIRLSVYAIPVWLLLIGLCYRIRCAFGAAANPRPAE